jgi:hypothetical protein
MHIDYRRAHEVFALMLDRYQTGQHPFVNIETDLPQNLVAPWITADPLRHARHLFAACYYMRGTVISSHAFRILNELHAEFPWLFNDEVLLFTTERDIKAALDTRIKWQSSQISSFWLRNARVLHEEWGGDPRAIFAGNPSRHTLYRRIIGQKYRHNGKHVAHRHQGFDGFQKKMASMLAYFLAATGHIEPTPLSAPVDFHHLRIYLATRMIDGVGSEVRYERVKDLGIQLAEYLQREFGLSQVEYGDIIWLWSLRSCGRAPYNQCTAIEGPNGREIRVPIPVTWSEVQVAAHTRTCGHCTLADHCTFGVPAGVYYTSGVFTLLPRTLPPQGRLFAAAALPVLLQPVRDVSDPFPARFHNAAE